MLATLLLDSRGLLDDLARAGDGGGRHLAALQARPRAEALTITGICVCYLGYNSGYYLPFGGGFMGPRFLMTMMPFLALPIGIALKRYPGPTIALAGVSLTTTIIATITHPLIGYETEAVTWMRYVREGLFQPTIASAYGLGRGWGGIWPFFLAAGGAVVLATLATARTRISRASLTRRRARARRLVRCLRCSAPPCSASTIRGCSTSSKRATTPRCTRALATTRYACSLLSPPAVGLFALICARIVAGGPVKRRPPEHRPARTITSQSV